MILTPKKYAMIGAVLVCLSIVATYFAREYKNQLHAEQSAKTTLQHEFDLAKASWIVKESQLTRKLNSSQGTRPAVVNGEVVRDKDGSIAYEQYQIISDEYQTVMKQLDVMREVIYSKEINIQELTEKLDKVETSKPTAKRFGALGMYSFPHWQAGAGFHQDFGIVDIGAYGLVGVPSLTSYSLALNARF